ncbi:MAG: CCA tRNA nucleotidyltransferase [Gemmatimonadota bacterium]|nr:CCA tRNA nucleotidyltransferase [Gemmatimonadota bacterium]
MTTARLNPPDTVREIADKLEGAGYETWCVGGAIRDALLGHPHLDWDLATAAPPEEVRKLFRRTVPVGIEFGTVGVLDRNNVMHEVTTFRRDIRTDGRHAVVEFGASLEEDLARRDYTINAMAYSPKRDELADPFGGRRDLDAKIVRAVGDPRQRLTEDRLRALRAIRFASRFDFKIDPATWDAIVESGPLLGRLSPERIKQEIEKTMEQVRYPSRAFKMWQDSGALATLIPPLAQADPSAFQVLDCLPLPGAPGGPQRKTTRIAALFSIVPAATAGKLLRGLRFSNAEISWITSLIERWHLLRTEMTWELATDSGPDDATLRRWAARTGRTLLAPVIRLASAFWACDREAGRDAPSTAKTRSAYRRAIRIAYHDPIEVADLAIDGDDLTGAGITGPAVGTTLRNLLETVINDPSANTRDNLLGLIVARRVSGQSQL